MKEAVGNGAAQSFVEQHEGEDTLHSLAAEPIGGLPFLGSLGPNTRAM